MKPSTGKLWRDQHDRHPGDRRRLFGAVSDAIDATTVLYPGSFVDLAPSFLWTDVTYVDVDRRAARFFDDAAGVDEIVADQRSANDTARWRFLHADYTTDLDLPDGAFDLLISLYAGLVSKHCTRHLRIGGWLLVNPSHGDVAMASIDARYRLDGVVESRSGDYSVRVEGLDRYLVPKRAQEITADSIERSGRGIAYTASPFAYLFRRIG